jgi:hypothetical protein
MLPGVPQVGVRSACAWPPVWTLRSVSAGVSAARCKGDHPLCATAAVAASEIHAALHSLCCNRWRSAADAASRVLAAQVAHCIGTDCRIGPKFRNASVGFARL